MSIPVRDVAVLPVCLTEHGSQYTWFLKMRRLAASAFAHTLLFGTFGASKHNIKYNQILFKKHSIFELLFSFFCVNWLIYKAIIFRASFAMSDKNPYGILSALQLDGDFVSPYPRPQPKMCVLVPICMVTAWCFFITCFHSLLWTFYFSCGTFIPERNIEWHDHKKKRTWNENTG